MASHNNILSHSPSAAVPEEIKGWNWPAFFLSWIWAFDNKINFGLLDWNFYFFAPFMFGSKGNELAWRSRDWQSVEEFRKSQSRYSRLVWVLVLGLVVGVFWMLSSAYMHH